MKKKSLALKLLELRQSHNLTQKELCESLNIGRSTYSYFETGNRIPDLETLLLIAQYYHVSLDKLVIDTYSDCTSKSDITEYSGIQSDSTEYSDTQLLHHLKSKNIPVDFVLELTKADYDFFKKFMDLSDENKAEIQYLINYKLRKQAK